MKRSNRISFRVTFTKPDGATVADCKDFTVNAMSSYHGSLQPPFAYGNEDDPGDPMFYFDSDTLKVTRVKPTRKSK